MYGGVLLCVEEGRGGGELLTEDGAALFLYFLLYLIGEDFFETVEVLGFGKGCFDLFEGEVVEVVGGKGDFCKDVSGWCVGCEFEGV